MKKICVITGSRAEFGILSPILHLLETYPEVDLQIIATNMHLSAEYGMTVNEIIAEGFHVNRKVEMLLSSDSAVGTVKSMGLAEIGFADAFEELYPDMILILGDRYEMLAAASAALIFGIPVVHLHGGEITEGAYDDAIRHAITKLSALHFTATEEYRQRVIQMGEDPQRVFCSGAPGIDNIDTDDILPLSELEKSIGFNLGNDYLLVTFHPVTTEIESAEYQIDALLGALESYFDRGKILFTLPNSDTAGRIIREKIEQWSAKFHNQVCVITSLGRKRYHSALAHCAAVVGNSSSGLIEAPSFGVPTLNIGNRQKGRTQGNTIFNCECTRDDITKGLDVITNSETRKYVKEHGVNPYHRAGSIEYIARMISETDIPRHTPKKFYDLKPYDLK